MNYYSENNKELRELVLKLVGSGFKNVKRINFAVSYSQNRTLSVVTIEPFPAPTIQALIFFYSRSLRLFEAIVYRGRRFYRLSRSGDTFKRMDRINKFIIERIARFSPIASRKIREVAGSDGGIELKNQQPQRLKDRNRIEKETNRSLRNQIKALRARQKRNPS